MKIIWSIVVLVGLSACNESADSKVETEKPKVKKVAGSNIDAKHSKEAILEDLKRLSMSDMTVDVANEIYKLSRQYHANFKTDKNAGNVIHESAIILSNYAGSDPSKPKRGISSKAIDLSDILIADYPDHTMIQRIYELKAMELDFNLEEDDKAIEVYKILLENYPNDTFNTTQYQYRIDHIKEPLIVFE